MVPTRLMAALTAQPSSRFNDWPGCPRDVAAQLGDVVLASFTQGHRFYCRRTRQRQVDTCPVESQQVMYLPCKPVVIGVEGLLDGEWQR